MRFLIPAVALIVAIVALAVIPGGDSEAAWPGLNGRIFYSDLAQNGIWSMNPDGSDREQLTSADGDDYPSVSPDGTKVAFQRSPGAVMMGEEDPGVAGVLSSQIWIMNADGSDPHYLTDGAHPSWDPTTARVYFARYDNPNDEIWGINADGQNLSVVLASEGDNFDFPVIHSDGSYMAFSYYPDAVMMLSSPSGEDPRVEGGPPPIAPDIWIWDGGVVYKQITDTPSEGEGPSDWHPTEHMLTFRTDGGIATVNVDSIMPSPTIIRPDNGTAGHEPAFSPDGTKIAYTVGPTIVIKGATDIAGGGSSIEVMDADGSDSHSLVGAAPGEYAADWQPVFPETPTPSPTATPSPTPSPTPTPGPTPVIETLVWGDANCSDAADPVDALLTLRQDAGLSVNVGQCPPLGIDIEVLVVSGAGLGEGDGDPQVWGNVDCDTIIVSPIDALKILRYDAALSYSQTGDCPPIGSDVTIQYEP